MIAISARSDSTTHPGLPAIWNSSNPRTSSANLVSASGCCSNRCCPPRTSMSYDRMSTPCVSRYHACRGAQCVSCSLTRGEGPSEGKLARQ